jgi:hypothetical protein
MSGRGDPRAAEHGFTLLELLVAITRAKPESARSTICTRGPARRRRATMRAISSAAEAKHRCSRAAAVPRANAGRRRRKAAGSSRHDSRERIAPAAARAGGRQSRRGRSHLRSRAQCRRFAGRPGARRCTPPGPAPGGRQSTLPPSRSRSVCRSSSAPASEVTGAAVERRHDPPPLEAFKLDLFRRPLGRHRTPCLNLASI